MLFTPHIWLPKAAAVAYTGPGDVVSGAYLWGGLRAYTAAAIGTKAIRLHAADTTESDFNTISGGGLDLASINSFIVAHGACSVAKLYDQTGNGRDQVQATVANQPAYSSTSGPGGKPGMSFASATDQFLRWLVDANINFPGTFSTVAIRTSNFTAPQVLCAQGTVNSMQLLRFDNAANTMMMYNGTAFTGVTAADNAYHALYSVMNGASSVMGVDGTTTTGNCGTTNASISSGSYLYFGDFDGLSFGVDGLMLEMGIWNFGFSSTNGSNMSSNQHSYWGF